MNGFTESTCWRRTIEPVFAGESVTGKNSFMTVTPGACQKRFVFEAEKIGFYD
jgi:hypothetical protein